MCGSLLYDGVELLAELAWFLVDEASAEWDEVGKQMQALRVVAFGDDGSRV